MPGLLLNSLNKMAADAQSTTPIVNISEHCTRRLHQASRCTSCIDVCPTKALELIDEQIHLGENTCTECGACASVCPMDAINFKHANTDEIRHQISQARSSDGTLLFACKQTSTTPNNTVLVPCLAILDEAMLLNACAQGINKLTLVCHQCQECHSQAAMPTLYHRIASLNILLATLGKMPSIIITDDVTENCDRADGRKEPGLSRLGASKRSMFSQLLGKLPEQPNPKPLMVANPASDNNASKLPAKWQQLQLSLSALGTSSQTNTISNLFKLPVIDAKDCCGCGICAHFCPTAALSCQQQDENLNLQLTPSNCVGCGICQDVCFCNAITLISRQKVTVLSNEITLLAKVAADSFF